MTFAKRALGCVCTMMFAGLLTLGCASSVTDETRVKPEPVGTVQQALTDLVMDIPLPTPPTPPTPVSGTAVYYVFPGRNGVSTVFSLPSTPNINSLLIFAHGVSCQRVASSPGNMEYILSGTTVTMGMAPSSSGAPFFAQYFT